MKNKRVYNDKILRMTAAMKGAFDDMDSYKTQAILGRFSKVVVVPEDVFYTKIVINTGRGTNAKFN